MTRSEQELVAEQQQRLAAMTEEAGEHYLAERGETNRRQELRERVREHRRHQLGVALIWLASLVFAFFLGYYATKRAHTLPALIATWAIVALVIGGAVLVHNNRHRRD